MDYEKILKRIVQIINTTENSDTGFTNICTYIGENCPELQKSEDERIRKELIDYINRLTVTPNNIDRYNAWITWLEKQGETNKTINRDEFAQGVLRGTAINLITWIDYNAAEGNMCLSNTECKDIEDALVSGNWNKIYAYMKKKLEKQDEKKHIFDFNANNWYVSKVDGKIHNLYNSGVEPKFHEGDWIVWQDKCYKVNYNGCRYELIDQNGLSTSLEHGTIDESAHLWDISDAKDGDVLAADECYVIFKEIDGLNIKCYCTYHYMGFNPSFHIDSLQNKTAFKPATKEQRYTLEKAMADAGYTFDFENKELKVTPIFNIGDTIVKKHNSDINKFGQFTITDISNGKYWYDESIICGITEQDEWELYKPVKQIPTEWSEEDEHRLKDTIYFLDTAKKHYASTVEIDACIDWLKSIKQ